MAKKVLNRADILNFNDFKMEEVFIPEWGGSVFVKSMTGDERDQYEASLINTSTDGGTPEMNMKNVRAKMVCITTIDPETKEQLFTAADIEMIGQKSAAALDAIFTVAQRLSKVSKEDIKELAKN